MPVVAIQHSIQASPEAVFRAVTHIEGLPDTHPDIVSVEFLSEQREGLGTRFVETRRMKGEKTMATELEVTEFIPNQRARMVADSHGTVWDSTFEVIPQGTGAQLTITMDARAHKLLPKLLNPIMKGFFRRGLQDHVEVVGRFCEEQAQGSKA